MAYPIRILDSQFNLLTEISSYSSLIIRRNFYMGDTLNMTINRNKLGTEHLLEGNILYNPSSLDQVFIIRYAKSETERDVSRDILNIRAVGCLQSLKQRIIVPPSGQSHERYLSTPLETILKNYINNAVISPTDTTRAISLFNLIATQGRGPVITDQSRYKNLFDEVLRLTDGTNYSICSRINLETEKIDFDWREGVDRSFGNGVNSEAVFSLEFGNVESQEYINSRLNYANTAYTGGQGESENRTIVLVNSTNSGLERFEAFVDARDLSNVTELEERGNQKLLEYPEPISLNSRILNRSNLLYTVDWDIGDLVTLEDKRLNLRINRRVRQVEEIREANQALEIRTIFGKEQTNLNSIIRLNDAKTVNEITR